MKKYITPEEFVKLPLSEAIDWVISDIENLPKGVKLYMPSFVWSEGDKCSVCIGGAAVLGFFPDVYKLNPDMAQKKFLKLWGKSIYYKIARTFDSLREGNISAAIFTWYGINELYNSSLLDSFRHSISMFETPSRRRVISHLKKVKKFLIKANKKIGTNY